MSRYSLTHLRGRDLEASYDRVASAGSQNTALQLAHLAELDHQGYYLDAGYSSMFRYCVSGKGLSEDVAVHWIRAARAGRTCPGVFEAIAEGRLNVSVVSLLSKHLTPEDAAELIAAAEKRSTKQVIRLIAERFGRPSRLDPRPATADNSLTVPATLRVGDKMISPSAGKNSRGTASAEAEGSSAETLQMDEPTPAGDGTPRRARIEPIGPGVFELVAQLGQEAYDQLEASRELLSHAVPNGALIEVIERAIALLHEHLRKRRCGATDRPRTGVEPRPSSNPRHLSPAVRRAVCERDGDQCTYVSPEGHRCEARDLIELDHIVPVAQGGASTVENLRLLCGPHNRHAAEHVFGKEHIKAKREEAQRRRAAERFHKQADRERTEKRKAEIERQREVLGQALKNLGWHGDKLERALGCCATRPDASLEDRIRYAVSFMAPHARKESPMAASPA